MLAGRSLGLMDGPRGPGHGSLLGRMRVFPLVVLRLVRGRVGQGLVGPGLVRRRGHDRPYRGGWCDLLGDEPAGARGYAVVRRDRCAAGRQDGGGEDSKQERAAHLPTVPGTDARWRPPRSRSSARVNRRLSLLTALATSALLRAGLGQVGGLALIGLGAGPGLLGLAACLLVRSRPSTSGSAVGARGARGRRCPPCCWCGEGCWWRRR